jgi:hypothetical protein
MPLNTSKLRVVNYKPCGPKALRTAHKGNIRAYKGNTSSKHFAEAMDSGCRSLNYIDSVRGALQNVPLKANVNAPFGLPEALLKELLNVGIGCNVEEGIEL